MKLLNIKDWSILNKLLLMVAITLIPIGIIFFYVMPMMAEKHLEGKHEEIKTAVEAPYNLIKFYHDKAKAGLITEEEAKAQAAAAISPLRYSGEEYYFVYDYEGNTISMGANSKLVGTNRWDFQDKQGNYIVRNIIETGRNGNGYYQYNYPKPGQTEELPKLSYIMNYREWNWVLGSGFYIDDVEKEIAAFKAKMYPILFGLILLSAISVFFLFKTIVVPVRKLKSAADKISTGEKNVKVEISSKDEIGDLGLTFNLMSENIVKHLNDANEKSELANELAAKAEQARLEAQDQKLYLEKNAKIILHEMEKFSSGDLTVSCPVENKNDDIGKLFIGFNTSVETIRKMMIDVMHAAEAAASATIQISSSSEELASGAQEQSSQANEVAASVEQMTATILQTTKNIGIASQVSLQAGQAAKDGGEVVLQTVDGMNRISEVVKQAAVTIKKLGNNSDQIGEIIQVIDDIADQTNLLALNAAIEAARAGEQGRGFAVVADEVRKLAERTTKATKEISVMIKNIQKDTHGAVESIQKGTEEVEIGKRLAEKAGSSLKQIIEGSDNVLGMINQVAAASEEQSAAAEEISNSITSISSVAQESAAGTQQIASAADDLNRLTDQLHKLISRFNVNNSVKQNY